MTTDTKAAPERKLGWEKWADGIYKYRTEHCDALVRQVGELWCTNVYYDGTLVDYGEWDGRGQAMRHVRVCAKHAVRMRSPLTLAKKADQEEDEDDDE